jgi:hypothetical protein
MSTIEEDKIDEEYIVEKIIETTSSLLKLAREITINKISENCLFILTEIKESDNLNKKPLEKHLEYQKIENLKSDLYKIYFDTYDFNLYINYALKNKTLIEIKYIKKKFDKLDNLDMIKFVGPMFHCKINTPLYSALNSKTKFDINWEKNTFNHKMKMLKWKILKK